MRIALKSVGFNIHITFIYLLIGRTRQTHSIDVNGSNDSSNFTIRFTDIILGKLLSIAMLLNGNINVVKKDSQKLKVILITKNYSVK